MKGQARIKMHRASTPCPLNMRISDTPPAIIIKRIMTRSTGVMPEKTRSTPTIIIITKRGKYLFDVFISESAGIENKKAKLPFCISMINKMPPKANTGNRLYMIAPRVLTPDIIACAT
jgi:hypothetical protein